MAKKRKEKNDRLYFGLNDLCITLGVLAGLAFGISYFKRNPEEAMVGGRFGGASGGGDIGATIYYMLLGGALGYIAYELYAKWKNRRK